MKITRFVVVAATALLAVGCGPGFQIIKQSNPNGLLHQKAYSVPPLDYSTMKIGNPASISEEEWINKKDSEGAKTELRTKLAQTKIEMDAKFRGRLAGAGASHGWQVTVGEAPSTLMIKASVVQFEPGIWIPFPRYATPAILRVGIAISDAQGVLLDQIEARSVVGADETHPEMAGRLAAAAEEIADHVLEYIQTRVEAQPPPKK